MADIDNVKFFGGAGRGQRVMLFLVSFILLFVGCLLCCAGELWAVVLYLPFVVGMVINDVEQSRKNNISRANRKAVSDKQNQ